MGTLSPTRTDFPPQRVIEERTYLFRIERIEEVDNKFEPGKKQLRWMYRCAEEGFEDIVFFKFTGMGTAQYKDQKTGQVKKPNARLALEAAEGRALREDELEEVDTALLHGRYVMGLVGMDQEGTEPRNKLYLTRAVPAGTPLPEQPDMRGQGGGPGSGNAGKVIKHPAFHSPTKPTPQQALAEAEREQEIAGELGYREPTEEELGTLHTRRKAALEALEQFAWWSEDDLPRHREQNIHGRPVSRFGNLAPSVQLYEVETLEMWASGKVKPDAVF